MALDQQDLNLLKTEIGTQTADQIQKKMLEADAALTTKFAEFKKGLMSEEEFTKFKTDIMEPVNAQLQKLEDAAKEQGNKIAAVLETAAPKSKSIEQFIVEQIPNLQELRKNGKMVEFSGAQLKAAGITSITGSVTDMTTPPGSPYVPGLGGPLEIFDIVRNPNYILDKVDVGSTSQSRLAWVNETDYQGAPAEVDESGTKPQTQHKFQSELSVAKKMASYISLSEEFDQDIPWLATKVRRMLQEDVIRGWDDAIQQAVIDAAHPYEIAQLDGNIDTGNYWDALLAMMAQIRYYNFMPNSIGINPLTNVLLKTSKSATDKLYLLPSFAGEIEAILTQANKVVVGNAFVGDLKQFKVDVYKDFYLKMGWINDDLIKNQFTIVGEVRYHRYISDARKKAIVYDSIQQTATRITGTPGS